MSLTVGDLTRLLRESWRLVALVTLFGVVAGMALAMIRDRPVSASVDVQVPVVLTGSAAPEVELAEGRQRVRTYVDLVRSERVVAPVAQQFGMTPAEVRSEVTALTAPDAAMFRLTVSDPEPYRAVAIAQAVSLKVVAAGRSDGLWANFARLDERSQPTVVVLGSAGVTGGIAGFIASGFVVAWRDRRSR